ncbi:MAG: DUF1289 domain-containing protein [Aestuariibacter sp.]
MEQLEFFDIPSPCIGVCESGAKGYCKGCYRTRDERLHWHNVNDEVKRKIIKACRLRKRRALASAKSTGSSSPETPQQGDLLNDL